MPDAPQPPIALRLSQAAHCLAARDYRAAEAICIDILKTAPQTPEAFHLLGVIAADHNKFASAIQHFDQAIACRAAFPQALAQKARSLMALGRSGEAVRTAEAAEALSPTDAYTLDILGVVFTRAGLHARAAPLYQRAAAIADAPGYHYNLAAALQFLGRMEEARAAYRACLRRSPTHAMAWSGLVQITRQTVEANDIAMLERAFAANPADLESSHVLGHALAKANEDLGRYREAMVWLAKAKDGHKPDATAEERLFAAAERTATLPLSGGLVGAQPVFIVGMPRTGTTLLDRILSSHSKLVSAGERNDFALALDRVTRRGVAGLFDPAVIDAAAAADPRVIGETYMASVGSALSLAGRFTDKQPINIYLAPHILRALPDARVICLRRHPADAVLSTYRQVFASTARVYDYTFDLKSAAQHYVRFDRLVRRFRETLPSDRFCEIWYERIVADIETETRRILAFCGLAFEPACIAFHENDAPVATASAAQVRQALYASSVNRWRRYRPMLDPALAVLIENNCLPAEDAPGLA